MEKEEVRIKKDDVINRFYEDYVKLNLLAVVRVN